MIIDQTVSHFFFLQYFLDRSKDCNFSRRRNIWKKYENVAWDFPRDGILNIRPEPHNWIGGRGKDSIKRKKKSGKDGDCSKRNEAILVPASSQETRPSFVLEKPFKNQGDKLGYVYLSTLEKREKASSVFTTRTQLLILYRPLLIRETMARKIRLPFSV